MEVFHLKNGSIKIRNNMDKECYKPIKIVMLPTDDESCLTLFDKLSYDKNLFDPHVVNNQHLYFLSGDMIGDDKWWMYVDLQGDCLFPIFKTSNCLSSDDLDLKIIASTNPLLNLPQPSEEFIKLYIEKYNINEKLEDVWALCDPKIGKCNKCGAEQLLSYYACNYNGVCNGEIIHIPKITNNEITLFLSNGDDQTDWEDITSQVMGKVEEASLKYAEDLSNSEVFKLQHQKDFIAGARFQAMRFIYRKKIGSIN